jgi:CRISPR-associated protein Cmr2
MADVLIVTLGPIQDFIAAARRTRDLWFGSWLLSELSKATAQAMAEECGLESLVFPGVIEEKELWAESSASVANKIVIRVPDGKEPAAVAERGRQGMQKRLDWLRDQAFKKIDPIDPLHFDSDKATAQVNDLIELAWVSAPEQGKDGYAKARERAEALLAARKNTRLWGTVTWGAEVPKSSIDGERESVLHEDLFNNVGKEGGLSPEQVRKRYGVGKTERLCGVGLLKRHGTRKATRYGHRFLSTGHLAAWPIYARTKEVDDPDLRAAWEAYLAVLEKGGVDLEEQEIVQGEGWRHNKVFGKYDGSLLFEGRLPDLFEEVTDAGLRQEGLREARKTLAAFLKKLGVPTPLPYYAILLADGDHMGKAIEQQTTFEDHQKLSRALDGFARSVRTTVEGDHGGELVYAGGDDVLAFVPLHKAIDCARKLSEDFLKALSGFPAGKDQTPTLSAGIGISHFMDPLRGALRLARDAEKLAKKTRNSLAVIVDKRSGPPVEVAGVWDTLDQRLDDYTDLHLADRVPDGAAYELRELSRLLERARDPEKESLEKLVKAEAKRILGRKQPAHGAQSNLDPEVFKRIAADFDTSPVAEVADRLIVARLLAQAKEEAGEKPVSSVREGEQP